MPGRSCRRLLAACSPIFVASNFVGSIFVASILVASILEAPTFLRGQDPAAGRVPILAPVLTTNPKPLRYSSPSEPVWIPPPRLPRPSPVGPGTIIFPQFVRAAGIIFSGRVTSVGRTPSSGGQAMASTSITFQVERAMRGASAGQSLTIHEWAGLWTGGERYRIGERVLLFLYSPGKLGLTSPVSGGMGRFAMDPQGRIMIGAQQVAILAANPILRAKTVVPYADFAQAVRHSSGEQ
jgi:hypothetical protein